jgi:hypothetical protein
MPSHASELVHVWNRCHNCGASPILGLRFSCQVCPAGADNDLCEPCYHLFVQGRIEHPSLTAREAPSGRHVFLAFEGIARERVLPWLSVPWSTPAALGVPQHGIVRPEFRSGRESFFGSYGFVVVAEDGGQPLVLTALHVLDELAKFRGIDCSDSNTSYSGRELPQQVTGVQLYDPFAANWMLAKIGAAGDMLPLPAARICAIEPYSQRDIAAFRIIRSTPFTLRLAPSLPAVGDSIWLAVSPRHGARDRTIPAVVVEIADETFVFRFAGAVTMPVHCSGAPLLNRAAEVVAINIGGGMLDECRLGHGCHVVSIRHHLGWKTKP